VAPELEQVAVHGAVHLGVIARCAGETVDEIRALNPELRRLATPANRTFSVRVPAGRAQAVASCLDERPPEERVTYRMHKVQRGQTLGSIARASGVSAREVAEANGLALQKRLRVGTELIIPVPPGPRVRRVRQQAPAADERDRVLHEIQPGDTLTSIAARYGTTVRELQAWNGLSGFSIAAGTVLTIQLGASRD